MVSEKTINEIWEQIPKEDREKFVLDYWNKVSPNTINILDPNLFEDDSDLKELRPQDINLDEINPQNMTEDEMFSVFNMLINSSDLNVVNKIGEIFGFEDLAELRNGKTVQVSVCTETTAIQNKGKQALTGNDNRDRDKVQYEIKTKKVSADYNNHNDSKKQYIINTNGNMSWNVYNRLSHVNWIIGVFKGNKNCVLDKIYYVNRENLIDYYQKWNLELRQYGIAHDTGIKLADIEDRGILVFDRENHIWKDTAEVNQQADFSIISDNLNDMWSLLPETGSERKEFLCKKLKKMDKLQDKAFDAMLYSNNNSAVHDYYKFASKFYNKNSCQAIDEEFDEAKRINNLLEDYYFLY